MKEAQNLTVLSLTKHEPTKLSFRVSIAAIKVCRVSPAIAKWKVPMRSRSIFGPA